MMEQVMLELSGGFLVTIELFVLTLLGALPLGLVIAFGSMSKLKPLRFLTRAIVWVVRGTPLMLQLILVYFGPGLLLDYQLWGGSSAGRFTAVTVTFIINLSLIHILQRGIKDYCKHEKTAQG